ncbi:unnamed protein product, partial [Sphenostylis stenocarpa]
RAISVLRGTPSPMHKQIKNTRILLVRKRPMVWSKNNMQKPKTGLSVSNEKLEAYE